MRERTARIGIRRGPSKVERIEHEQRHKYTAKARATNDAKSKNRSRDLKTMQAKTKNIITDCVDLPSEYEKQKEKQMQENQAKERMTDHALAI